MSITGRIHAKYDRMTRTEQKIADYILNNSPQVAFNTLEELATGIGVSTTSVIRFARTLQYDGYTQMQQSIQQSLVKKVSLPERYDESYALLQKDNILHDLLHAEIDSLKRSAALLNSDSLHEAVEAINKAHTVFILGVRSTFGLAHYMAANLSQVRGNVHLISGVGGMYPEEIVGAKAGDVCIAYMFPRYQRIVSGLLSAMKEKGVTVILITSKPHDTIQHLGDIFLCCSLQSGIMTKDSMIPPMFISNYLYTCVMANDYQETRARLESMEEILDKGYYFGI